METAAAMLDLESTNLRLRNQMHLQDYLTKAEVRDNRRDLDLNARSSSIVDRLDVILEYRELLEALTLRLDTYTPHLAVPTS
jgi:hypothetical protein